MGLFGSKSSTESRPVTSKSQQATEKKVADSFGNLLNLTNRNINMSGQNLSYVDLAKRSAIENMLASSGTVLNAFTRAAEGEPVFEFDYDIFDDTVATPLMSSFKEHLAPLIGEGIATSGQTPGSFYSSNVNKGTVAAGTQFYNQNVLPILQQQLMAGIQSGETAANRSIQGASGLAQYPLQQAAGITNIQNAELQAIVQALSAGGQFATTPTIENTTTISDGLDIGGAFSGGLGGFALGKLVTGLNPMAGLAMGAAGGLF